MNFLLIIILSINLIRRQINLPTKLVILSFLTINFTQIKAQTIECGQDIEISALQADENEDTIGDACDEYLGKDDRTDENENGPPDCLENASEPEPCDLTISKQPRDASVEPFGNVSFSVEVKVKGTINGQESYQWYYSPTSSSNDDFWVPLTDEVSGSPYFSGTTTSTLTMSNVPLRSWDRSYFRVVISYSCGQQIKEKTSKYAELHVKAPPVFIEQPKHATVCLGNKATFNTTVGFGEIAKWQESVDDGQTWSDMSNSSDVEGVERFNLILKNVPSFFSGRRYRLRATNDYGTTYSRIVNLTVVTPPKVIIHPSGQSIKAGGNVTFSAAFNYATSVQWVYTIDGGSTWNTLNDGGSSPGISGATTNTLNLNDVPSTWHGREFALSGLNASCPPSYSNRALLEVTNSAPIAKCKNIIFLYLQSGNSCLEKIQTGLIDDGSYDPDGDPISLSLDIDEFTVGAHTVILTVSDGGLTDQCSTPVIVEDYTPPEALCKDVTLQLDENGQASLTADDINNGSFDNCGINQMTINVSEFDCSNLGSNRITLRVRDTAGGRDDCKATVTVEDKMAPVARCKNMKIPLDASGEAIITAQEFDNGSTDNCGTVQFEFSDGSTELKRYCDNRPISKTLHLKDSNGNQSTCEVNIRAVDNIPPTAKCKDITINLDDYGNAWYSIADVENGSSDNCGVASISYPRLWLSCNDIGTFEVKHTVTEHYGINTDSCTAKITVVDQLIPMALCQDITLQLNKNGQASLTVDDINNGSSDNCGIEQMFVTVSEFDCSNLGPNTVQLKVTDSSGNLGTCSAAVTVEDNMAPVARCKNMDVPLDATGEATITAQDFDDGSKDNCGTVQFEFSDGSTELKINCNTEPFLKTLILRDGNGMQSICVVRIKSVDNIPPTAKCKDRTLRLNSFGEQRYRIASIDNGSFDNCGFPPSGRLKFETVNCSDIGTFEVTLVITDLAGNSNFCTGKITVVDKLKPVPDVASLPTIEGQCGATVSPPTATDNCAGTITGTTNDPTSFSQPGNYIITWTFDDGNGNTSSQDQTIVIKDVTAPVLNVANLPTITASCEAGLEPPFATDNCAGQIIGTTSDPLYFDKEGTYTVTWIFDDGNGNSSSQDQTIVIMSDAAPVPDRQTLPTLRAQCGLTISSTPTASDGCGGTIVGTTSDPLTYHTQGTYLITWTFDNGNGNTSSQTQKVVIRDTKAPVPERPNLPALGGSCSLLITNFPTATDNCTGTVTATTDSPLEYDQEGTFALTWNYEDGNGNTSSQTQWVIISSDAEPAAECKNISVALGSNNQVNIKAEDIDKGSYDECGPVSLLISSAGGSVFGNALPPAPSMDLYCKDGKVHNLMLLVTNEKGNTAHCQATVFLEGADSDNDGILDQCDNCPDTYNSDQKDSNNNGTGDACEENANPDPNPGGWGGWSLKKQSSDPENIITELRAFPNPFQEEVNLSFSLDQQERTTIEIFNIQGQRVHTLLSEIAPKGEHRVQWDGKDQNGQPMPDGIYLIRLRAGKALINQKVILQR